MLGAIAGDIIGSPYEAAPIKTKSFQLLSARSTFTDDTVCTVAIAHALLGDGDFAGSLRIFVAAHPVRGYGGMFLEWAMSPGAPAYGSWGNGSAMRVSPVGHAAHDAVEVLHLAAESCAVSHDHPEAVRGAQAAALAVWLARQGADREAIRAEIAHRFGYDLSASLTAIRPRYRFDVSAAGTVPPALIAALEASDYEDAVRNAISLGGDSDTLAAIAGAVAEPLFGIPDHIAQEARSRLTPDLLDVLDRFKHRFIAPGGESAA